MKVVYSQAQGEAKLHILEAQAEDDGTYKLEATNEFGTASLTCTVVVICEYIFFSYSIIIK